MTKTPLTTPKEGLRAALFAIDRIDANLTSDTLGLLLINIDDLLSYAEKLALKEEGYNAAHVETLAEDEERGVLNAEEEVRAWREEPDPDDLRG